MKPSGYKNLEKLTMLKNGCKDILVFYSILNFLRACFSAYLSDKKVIQF